ncbi:type I restriction endonuclease subunit R [Nocardiopsis dassonvillei]|uniref:Type I restriction enzyme endonuclease subunit n=1 Tax=Nocardiopsis dassonvillei (strain ATCC 23218 / DSM 43111 / CIP 107115 / JCM 7437 / KCTC 9190 / NBRC 14626 / NCTC 10488 / NRRL B-5397 / IMRU 509) TaxID=446468 RepID=D7B1R5_NOCDD|nr:type I restriction endonuclease subunit R [Nocardiopsis dassonvillei]ADH68491.1 type I site-specific deoxyribonuclease, HsdR family [Nocardiopsis dassonvillei subsp. dassonvillei DSM 43111]NKY80159.1 type I restriction endonuclease subunit R [Nocardiopsis dassonvillei]VEI88999.1 Type-1 restriction enzyme R protein [Nocardiopsis dassonvillei]
MSQYADDGIPIYPRDPDEAQWEAWALEWLAEPCGWEPVRGQDLAPRKDGSGERRAWDDLLLTERLRSALTRINPQLPDDAVDEVIEELGRRESSDPFHEFHRLHTLLTQGVKVEVTDPDTGQTVTETAWPIDFNDPHSNAFVAANQVTVKDLAGSASRTRPRRLDIVGYVNGIPLAVFELKAAGSEDGSREAHAQLLTYRTEYGATALAPVAFAIASDGITARVGTPHTPWEHMAPWEVNDAGDPLELAAGQDDHEHLVALESLVSGVFGPVRFLDLLENFLAFSRDEGSTVDTVRLAKAHQYIAVNKAIDRTITAVSSNGKIGVVWHTQGSGKSKEMEFYAAKALKHPALRNPTIVVLTDRLDLDSQLYATFAASALLPEEPKQAALSEHLSHLLERPSGGIVFTTLQKFRITKDEKEAGLQHRVLSARRNVIVIVDEAHRSHYGLLEGYAKNLRDALPNAAYIAFTGTPIAAADRDTRAVFGDDIDVYDLTRAVRDGATVRVFYENRHIPVSLPQDIDPELLDGRAEDLTAELDEEERKRANRALAAYEDVVGSPERIRKLAADIVDHWKQRREEMGKLLVTTGENPRPSPGKAMIVGLSRKVCADLYAAIIQLEPTWHSDDDADGVIKCVYTGQASDPEPTRTHVRTPTRIKAIQRRATDPEDKLELVIVQSLWLTGFDSPPLHTLYLDKPMRGAALMQAIARVNRRFGEKPSGLVVDFLGIADKLTQALMEYTLTDQDERPVGREVSEAVAIVQEQHHILDGILHGLNWRLTRDSGRPKAFVNAVLDAVEFLQQPEPDLEEGRPTLVRRFTKHARDLVRAFALCPTEPELDPIRPDLKFFDSVRHYVVKLDTEAKAARGLATAADVELAIRQLTASAVAADEVVDIYEAAGLQKPDLSHLDEEFVRRLRESERPHLAIEALRRSIEREVKAVYPHNVVKQEKFVEKLLHTMNRYRNGALTSAAVIAQMVELAKEVSADRGRAAELGLSEDELAFYDAVAKNEAAVKVMGTGKLAAIARDLVTQVQSSASIDWSQRDEVKSYMMSRIKRLLRRHGYPPDAQPSAVEEVLKQARGYGEYWSNR